MKSESFQQALAFARLPDELRSRVETALATQAFVPSHLVAACLDVMSIGIEQLMIRLLPVAAVYARVPISDFPVGAVALGMPPPSAATGPGNLYFGANMEFLGQALSCSVHGEQSAVNNAWLHGENGLQSMATNAAPCGHCRQFLYELTTATNGFKMLRKKSKDPNDDSCTSHPLTQILPEPFGPLDLGVTGGLMRREDHGLQIKAKSPAGMAAIEAANSSYSPYTNGYSGVGLVTGDGRVIGGRYAENAAYNPSLSPLASALAFMNMSQVPGSPFHIVEAVLVEAAAKMSQKDATGALLSAVAPGVELQYLSAN
jgi:cytidine deaminase